MGVKLFGAIHIGSYEVSLKIFEISQKKYLKKVDYIRSRLPLGKDAYSKGMIGYELVEELCNVLKEFHRIMEGYGVEDYRAYAGSALKNIENELFILDQIQLRTKLKVQVLSNSEYRFMGYKSLGMQESFQKMIEEGAAVVDVGGGSMQITLFSEGRATTTRQIVLGLLRIQEKISLLSSRVSNYEMQVRELVDKELELFKKLYLQEEPPKYLIISGVYMSDIAKKVDKKEEDGSIDKKYFLKILEKFHKKTVYEIAQDLNLSNDHDPLLIPSIVLYKRLAEEMNPEYIWVSGVSINDGIACDYVEKYKMFQPLHDFEKDIISSSQSLAERYQGNNQHTKAVTEAAVTIFDAMKHDHGLTKRGRVLLESAAILHDCGRYISLANQAECSYHIIMATEIMGMSHLEREIVANVVRYSSAETIPYQLLKGTLDQESCMMVAKLTAILKIANCLDRSHKQKIKSIKAQRKGKILVLTVETAQSLILETSLFGEAAKSFEKVFSIQPRVKEKRGLY